MNDYKLWKKYFKKHYHYHQENSKQVLKLIETDSSVVEFGARGGELLKKLPNKIKLGVNLSADFPTSNGKVKLINFSKLNNIHRKFDYVILNFYLSEIDDVQIFLRKIKRLLHDDSIVIVMSFNFMWKPVLDLAGKLKLKYPFPKEPNWIDEPDLETMFLLENLRKVTSERLTLMPFYIPLVSKILNGVISKLPIVNHFCLTQLFIFRPIKKPSDYSVSIIIPARNEEGNIPGILKKIPTLGPKTEIVFVEGHSTDNTYRAIEHEIKTYTGKLEASLYSQKGVGKADAVKLGFSKANGELLMILDADLTVAPNELEKFYLALKHNYGDFVMGSRFVYPQEKQAMRNLNYLGNKIFSLLFTYLLGQRVKDTLCGTKVILRKHYQKLEKSNYFNPTSDPFGDFELIFTAKRLHLKILEIPVRYKERTYGETNISRFKHGWLLLKVLLITLFKSELS